MGRAKKKNAEPKKNKEIEVMSQSGAKVPVLEINGMVFREGDTIQVTKPFRVHSKPPGNIMLTPDMNDLAIISVYADGWISINRLNTPWPQNKPICHHAFVDIEVESRETREYKESMKAFDYIDDLDDGGDILKRAQLLNDNQSEDEMFEEAANKNLSAVRNEFDPRPTY